MPEPVTTAILAALAVAGSETVKLAVDEAYAGLRSLLVRKLGGSSNGVEALAKLEEDPTSAGWKETTIKELAKAGVDQDPELVGGFTRSSQHRGGGVVRWRVGGARIELYGES
jgi:hypothetical protein